MDIFAKQQWHCPPGSSQVNLTSCDPPQWLASIVQLLLLLPGVCVKRTAAVD
jgi:hypothetical protein